jgi:hypothetical protein
LIWRANLHQDLIFDLLNYAGPKRLQFGEEGGFVGLRPPAID